MHHELPEILYSVHWPLGPSDRYALYRVDTDLLLATERCRSRFSRLTVFLKELGCKIEYKELSHEWLEQHRKDLDWPDSCDKLDFTKKVKIDVVTWHGSRDTKYGVYVENVLAGTFKERHLVDNFILRHTDRNVRERMPTMQWINRAIDNKKGKIFPVRLETLWLQ